MISLIFAVFFVVVGFIIGGVMLSFGCRDHGPGFWCRSAYSIAGLIIRQVPIFCYFSPEINWHAIVAAEFCMLFMAVGCSLAWISIERDYQRREKFLPHPNGSDVCRN